MARHWKAWSAGLRLWRLTSIKYFEKDWAGFCRFEIVWVRIKVFVSEEQSWYNLKDTKPPRVWICLKNRFWTGSSKPNKFIQFHFSSPIEATYSHYAICISIIAASFYLSSVVWPRTHWMHSLTFMTLWFHKLCHGVKICWFKDLQNLVLRKDINEKRFTYIAWWIAATLFRQKAHSFWVELEGFLTQIKLLDCEHYQWITLTWVRIRLKVEREAEV